MTTFAEPRAWTARLEVPYSATPDGPLACDLYLPAGPAPHPAAILVHGGAWQRGSRAAFRELGPHLAGHGYAAMAISYRLSRPERPTWPAALDDVRAAHDWLVAHAAELGVDARRIALVGASAGAHLVTLLTLERPERVAAVVGVYGVYDLEAWWAYTQAARDDDAVTRFMGAPPHAAPEAYAAASPMARLKAMAERGERLAVPFLVVWGDQDEVVPPEESAAFAAALRRVGAPVEELLVPGVGHFWFSLSDGRPGGGVADHPNPWVLPQVLRFLGQRLGVAA